jgi:hypothetical protein
MQGQREAAAAGTNPFTHQDIVACEELRPFVDHLQGASPAARLNRLAQIICPPGRYQRVHREEADLAIAGEFQLHHVNVNDLERMNAEDRDLYVYLVQFMSAHMCEVLHNIPVFRARGVHPWYR